MGWRLVLVLVLGGCATHRQGFSSPEIEVAPENIGPGTAEGDAWTLLSDDLHLMVGIVRLEQGKLIIERFPNRRVVHGYPSALRRTATGFIITMPENDPVIIDDRGVHQGTFVF